MDDLFSIAIATWEPQIDDEVLAQLYRLIRDHGPITGARLAQALGTTRRRVSDLVRTLIMEYHIPIGGKMEGRMGYFLIRTPEEKRRELAALGSRVREIVARMRVLSGLPERALLHDLFEGEV